MGSGQVSGREQKFIKDLEIEHNKDLPKRKTNDSNVISNVFPSKLMQTLYSLYSKLECLISCPTLPFRLKARFSNVLKTV